MESFNHWNSNVVMVTTLRSDMILIEVSQRAYDMIHYISGLFGYF